MRYLFIYGPILPFLLTLFVFVRPLRLRVRAQAIWTIVLLLGFSKFMGFEYLGGSAFSPELPALVVWVWDWLYSGAMLMAGISLVLFFRFPKKAWIIPAIAFGLSALGLWNGLCLPKVHRFELNFDNLPSALDGYRIVHLSDLHCSVSSRRWRTEAVVDLANAQDADLMCVTGDLVDGHPARRAVDIAPIAKLRAKDGVYHVTGNHEYYFDFIGWRAYYLQLGLRFLDNECVFPRPGLALGGVPHWAGARKELDAFPDVRGAFAAATNGEFRILLVHEPGHAKENIEIVGVDLQLSGHTHGGIAPILSNIVAAHNHGFVRGLYAIGKSFAYVSTGCGQWAGFPIRFCNPSEISVITLRRARNLNGH